MAILIEMTYLRKSLSEVLFEAYTYQNMHYAKRVYMAAVVSWRICDNCGVGDENETYFVVLCLFIANQKHCSLI